MAIVLDTTSLPDIESYAGLLNAVALWLDRDDLTDRIPYFVRLAESRFRRLITRTEREATIALPSKLPADFDSVRSLKANGPYGGSMEQVSPAELDDRWGYDSDLPPRVYAILDGCFKVGPKPLKPYSATLVYNREIPHLSPSVQSNWLLEDHPDLYLFGALLQAEFYGWNDERLGLIKASVDETIEEVNMAGHRRRYGGGPLVMRSDVRERGACQIPR